MTCKLSLVVAAASVMLTTLACQHTPEASEPVASTAEPQPQPQPRAFVSSTTYASLLEGIDARVDSLQKRSNARGDDWLTRMHLATALLDRAALTNRIEDFERVQTVLDESFAIAREGSGPILLAARYNFAIHRLDRAEHYLDRLDARAVPRGDDKIAAHMLRAQIALQRGQYDTALSGLDDVASAVPAIATAELALYHAKTGDSERADALLQQALAGTSKKDPRRRAWTILQRGLIAIDHGAYLQALERLQEADAELPGWWLVQEHIAEVHDRLGQHRQAIAIYERLVEDGGLPQHMDALASVYQHAGEPERAVPLIAQADALWEEQLAQLPEAAMGHGLEHQLQHGRAVRALELAEANYAVRPGGDAEVALARAYLGAGRPTDALAHAERALASPYRTAGLHDVAARSYATLGNVEAAQQQLALCTAFNPSYQSQQHTH